MNFSFAYVGSANKIYRFEQCRSDEEMKNPTKCFTVNNS